MASENRPDAKRPPAPRSRTSPAEEGSIVTKHVGQSSRLPSSVIGVATRGIVSWPAPASIGVHTDGGLSGDRTGASETHNPDAQTSGEGHASSPHGIPSGRVGA